MDSDSIKCKFSFREAKSILRWQTTLVDNIWVTVSHLIKSEPNEVGFGWEWKYRVQITHPNRDRYIF